MASCGASEKFCESSDADGVICRCQLSWEKTKSAQYIYCHRVGTNRLVPGVAVHCRRSHPFVDAALTTTIDTQPLGLELQKN
jgi:hypothetical protein